MIREILHFSYVWFKYVSVKMYIIKGVVDML